MRRSRQALAMLLLPANGAGDDRYARPALSKPTRHPGRISSLTTTRRECMFNPEVALNFLPRGPIDDHST
jgi:hypothetical protein